MQFRYELSSDIYNSSYAIGYKICFEHLRKGTEAAEIKDRIVHLAIGILEAIPVIGQVAALAEIFILQKLTSHHVNGIYESLIKQNKFNLDSNDPEYLKLQPEFKNLRTRVKRLPTTFRSAETVRKVKELASCPELIEARAALSVGILPQPTEGGISGSYILKGRKKQNLGIFKPSQQEAGMVGNPNGMLVEKLFGVVPGTSYLREYVAHILDKRSQFVGVPTTKITHIEMKYFPSRYSKKAASGVFVGSFQKWADNTHPAITDLPFAPKLFTKTRGHEIPATQIHKIAIFDIRTLNCDRHLQNFLISEERDCAYPIDHGYAFPGDAKSLRFDWMNFPQAKTPFSEEALNHIRALDANADIALIKKHIPNIAQDTLDMIRISIRLLQIAAAKGLNAHQIADLFMRRKHEGLLSIINNFMPIPSTIPSYFHTNIWLKLKKDPSLNLEAFLNSEVDTYYDAHLGVLGRVGTWFSSQN